MQYTVLIIYAQFLTGLYYTFDAQNTYQRSQWNILCFVIPILIVLIQGSTIIQYRGNLPHHYASLLMVSLAIPTAAAIVQVFTYGLSLINMSTALMVILFFVFALNDLSETVAQARLREIEFYKAAQAKEAALFVETAEALVNAIDAKDKYTHGHSARVAQYSEQIAREAGLSDEDCRRVYFAALLHDVGKIGVSNDIINKAGRLTDEEFAEIKRHTILGNQILSSIHQSPYLCLGAHYHHERYDGKGYPEGLAGEDIPEIARIIAVADAYDAMTSRRSYREPLPQEKVRAEFAKGIGAQFDPRFAAIMLRFIDSDREYHMREE